MKNENPDDWIAPPWHSDYGDPNEELELLKIACKTIIKERPNIALKIKFFEDGYMNVDIFNSKEEKIGELYIVEGDSNKQYGLFIFDDKNGEHYFENHTNVLKYLKQE